MRCEFLELPGRESTLLRPVIPVQVEDLEEAPQLCLVDTGATTNRFGAWLAEATGIAISPARPRGPGGGGGRHDDRAPRARRPDDRRYQAPVAFCDPWPFAFNLLGQEGFPRFFRVTLCAHDFWLDVEPEAGE